MRNGQWEELARAIRELKADPERLARMRTVCRRLYEEKYSMELGTRKYGRLFRELLKSRGGQRSKHYEYFLPTRP